MAVLNSVKRLNATLSAVCPILGVSVGTLGDNATVRIDYAPSATQAERDAAVAALAAFDWSDAAQTAWEAEQAITNAVTLTMTGMTPANISDRVTLRYIITCLNDVREHVGLPRILEADHINGLMASVALGAGDPVNP